MGSGQWVAGVAFPLWGTGELRLTPWPGPKLSSG